MRSYVGVVEEWEKGSSVFGVKWENGMVFNAGKLHKWRQLDVGTGTDSVYFSVKKQFRQKRPLLSDYVSLHNRVCCPGTWLVFSSKITEKDCLKGLELSSCRYSSRH